MPFKIVRNDITKVKADVIVNTANPNPICASGTDLAIYEAAGKEKLLAERAGIGKIAMSVFSQFLTENEIEIILVVFDKRSFQLSGQIVGDIDSYIDANYVRESHRKEYPVRSRSNARMRGLTEERE